MILPMRSMPSRWRAIAALAACLIVLAGCSAFPKKPQPGVRFADGLDAQQIFARCLAAHGGDLRGHVGDVNLSTDGRWHTLIQKIQPIVSDARYRVASQERYRPGDGIYAVHHDGPDGSKQVVRTREGVSVAYNGVATTDADKLAATRMTNDAFQLFHFGPSYLVSRASTSRLSDAEEGGRRYYRLFATITPGFGDAASDDLVLWIDATTLRLWRVHMTLNGVASTQGAHVDTTFLAYHEIGGYVFPVKFIERVRGPIRVTAHEWRVTGIDLDRGWSTSDVTGAAFGGKAAAPATSIETVGSN